MPETSASTIVSPESYPDLLNLDSASPSLGVEPVTPPEDTFTNNELVNATVGEAQPVVAPEVVIEQIKQSREETARVTAEYIRIRQEQKQRATDNNNTKLEIKAELDNSVDEENIKNKISEVDSIIKTLTEILAKNPNNFAAERQLAEYNAFKENLEIDLAELNLVVTEAVDILRTPLEENMYVDESEDGQDVEKTFKKDRKRFEQKQHSNFS